MSQVQFRLRYVAKDVEYFAVRPSVLANVKYTNKQILFSGGSTQKVEPVRSIYP